MAVPEQKVVLAFGVFDLLHSGHVFFLQRAAEMGERLVVVVASDDRVMASKGRRPLMTLDERLAVVAALGCVDRAVAGDPPGEWKALLRHRPAVIALGHDQGIDQSGIKDQLQKLDPQPEIVVVPRKGTLSSSDIKRRLLDERAKGQ